MPVPALPSDLRALAQEIAAAAAMRIEPDLCLINYYDAEGRMGLHQDKDEGPESIGAGIPVVSVSLGDTARFLFGGLKRRDPIEPIHSNREMSSCLEDRRAFVTTACRASCLAPHPAKLGLNGRFNLTFRQSDEACRASS